MKIGIIADTHDRLPFIDKAVQRLNKEKVELVLHAGDYIAPFVTVHFEPLEAKMIGVFGNNDGEKNLLRKKFGELGTEIRGSFAEIKVDRLNIAVLHGEETDLLESLVSTSYYNVIVHGHTHRAQTYKEGRTLVLNPGEVCGYLTGQATIAVLNTKTMDVKEILLTAPCV